MEASEGVSPWLAKDNIPLDCFGGSLVSAAESGFGAEGAGKFVPDVFGAAERTGYPVASGPRGIVADVLLMAAFEVGDPVEGLVGVKPHDLARDSRRFRFHGLHNWLSNITLFMCL